MRDLFALMRLNERSMAHVFVLANYTKLLQRQASQLRTTTAN